MDLMYGLMLPSGNDASLALAELVGELIHTGYGHSFGYICSFVNEMNRFAKHMGLKSTYYTNPHGMKAGNKSTCKDISLLGSYLMSEPEIEEI
jgi:D-alanyl-D-alanine carboxypeptidase (penicillin-binding protein 5/6)